LITLREVLSGVRAEGYAYNHALGINQPAQLLLRSSRNDLRKQLPVGFHVLASGRAINLPLIPWLAIVDPDVTTTAQRGIFVVYLFAADLARVYLTVNQGVTAISNTAATTSTGTPS